MSRPRDLYPKRQRRYPTQAGERTSGANRESLVARAFHDLWRGSFAEAEHGFALSLATGMAHAAERAVSIVGVAQARLFGRLDARGAFAILQAMLAEEPGATALPSPRLHVVASFLFSTPEPGLLNPGRSGAHADRAQVLLARQPDPDLTALAAVAELNAAVLGRAPQAYLARAEARLAQLEDAESPITRCLVLEASATVAMARGDAEREGKLLARALVASRAAGFAACEARLLSRQAERALSEGKLAEAHGCLVQASTALVNARAEGSWLELALAEVRRSTVPDVHRPFGGKIPAAPGSASAHEGLQAAAQPATGFCPGWLPESLDLEVRRLAPSRATVLLVGGSKALQVSVARALHNRSSRAQGPFVALDCELLAPDEVERVLFGGPYYGENKSGAVHEAEHGTLFVAAIDELPVLVQPSFLRFLDASRPVRVVASSSIDLRVSAGDGGFRADLGERLSLVQLVLPKQP